MIRNFYFGESQKEAGMKLLNEAMKALSNTADIIYAFFTILACPVTHAMASCLKALDIYIIYWNRMVLP